MNPDFPKTPREELEAKLTALLLGELPADDAAALRRAIEQDAELAKLYDRLKQTIELVRETAVSPAAETAEATAPLKLSEERRQKLLAHFKTISPKEFEQPRRREMPWFVPMAAAAILVFLIGVVALLPDLRPRFQLMRSMSRLGEEESVTALSGHAAANVPAAPSTNMISPPETHSAGEFRYLARRPIAAPAKGGGESQTPAPVQTDVDAYARRIAGSANVKTPPGTPVGAPSDSTLTFYRLTESKPGAPATPPPAMVLPAVPSPDSGHAESVLKLTPQGYSPLNANATPPATHAAGDVAVYLPPAETPAKKSGDISAGDNRQQLAELSTRNSFGINQGATPLASAPPPVSGEGRPEIVLPAREALADAAGKPASESTPTANGITGSSVMNYAKASDVSGALSSLGGGGGFGGGAGGGGFGGGGGMGGGGGGYGGGGRGGGGVPAPTLPRPAETASEINMKDQFAEAGKSDHNAVALNTNLGNQNTRNAAYGNTTIQVGPGSRGLIINADAATTQAITNAVAQLDRAKSDTDKVPVLGDVPNAGRLFRSESETTDDNGVRLAFVPPEATHSMTNAFAGRYEYQFNNEGAVNINTTKAPVPGDLPALGKLYTGTTRDDVSGLQSLGATTELGYYSVGKTPIADVNGHSYLGVDSSGSLAVDSGVRATNQIVAGLPWSSTLSGQVDTSAQWNFSSEPRTTLAANFADAQQVQEKLRNMFPNGSANQSSTLTTRQQQQQTTTTDTLRLAAAKEAAPATDAAVQENVRRQAVRAPIVPPPGTAGSAQGNDTTYAYGGRVGGDGTVIAGTGGTNALQLNFQNTPISAALNYLADAGHFIIEMDTPVRGNVTATGKNLTGEDAVDVLSRELNRNGYAIVRNGRTLRIMGTEEAKTSHIPVRIGNEPTNIPNNDEIVTQVIPISFVEAGQLIKDLAPMTSAHATIIANDKGKEILVTDTQENIKHLAEIIKAVDTPDVGTSKENLRRAMAAKMGQTPALVPNEDRPAPRPAAPAPEPQPEVQSSDNAFSTFSLNVSDVSFKLAAASLEKGQMPEPATVRSEEFINAFDYRDPEPPPGAPIGFAWERAHYPFAHNRDLLRFSVKTAAQGRQPGRPLNIVLLLDNSGSMERADRVRIIHEALRVLAAQLQPQDKLSVVTFARTPRLWVDGVPGDQAGAVLEQVGNLTPQGGTNLEEAMRLAYETALRHYFANGVNRVVLLTDGAANLGNVDPTALEQRVETNRKQGIALDCFGIGWEGYNDDLLEVLSRNGDGRYAFINTPEEAAGEFATKLAGALQVAASDVKVQVEFNPKRTTAYRQIGYAKHQLTKEQFRDNTVNAAQIGAAESGNALYVVEVNPQGEGPVATVRVRYRVPGTADYRENAFDVPYTGNAASLEQASPAMRLAATASAFSEWLVSSPFAAEVTPDQLLNTLSGVPEIYGADARPKTLEWMIRQAKSVAGK